MLFTPQDQAMYRSDPSMAQAQLQHGHTRPMPMGTYPQGLPYQSSASYQSRGSPQAVRVPVSTPPAAYSSRHVVHNLAAGTQRGTLPTECKDECAEEECDQEECGAEHAAPRVDSLACGIDTKYILPASLSFSMVAGLVSMAFVQAPMICKIFDFGTIAGDLFVGILVVIYVSTLGCMALCAFSDPGQVVEQESERVALVTEEGKPLPKRAHKTWQYARPVRRYDHYCRWVTNCIGLLNHRPFIIMCVGIVVVAMVGALIDGMLVVHYIEAKTADVRLLCILLHAAYSVLLFCLAGPILRIHIGLVSRNELANEWKRNDFYVARESKHGKDVPVNDLSDNEFNSLFDEFVYDRRKNPFDQGVTTNCWVFWCTSRWAKNQLGEF